MNNTAVYNLQSTGHIVSHFPAFPSFFRDAAYNEDDMLLQARIRSGDYFMTLATELDMIAQQLAAAGAPETLEVERLAAELIRVNKDYTVVKKS